MQKQELLVFDENDVKIAEMIEVCEETLRPQDARVFWLILQKGRMNAKSVAKSLDMHQPQVSEVLNRLREMGWIGSDQVKLERGRPQNVYFSKFTKSDFITLVEKHQEEHHEMMLAIVEKLKKQIAE